MQDQIDGRGVIVAGNSLAWTVGAVGPVCQGTTVNAVMQLVDGTPTTIAKADDQRAFGSLVSDGATLYASDGSSIVRVPLR